jgi:O-antigen ligase
VQPDPSRVTIPVVLHQLRAMPGGIRLFLVYAFVILALIGLSLRFVVDLAIGAPVSGPGVVVMVLLAYTIFTTTMVIQRKQAARGLALGLASLTVPLIPYLLLAGLIPHTVFVLVLAILLFRGLLGDDARAWLNEE